MSEQRKRLPLSQIYRCFSSHYYWKLRLKLGSICCCACSDHMQLEGKAAPSQSQLDHSCSIYCQFFWLTAWATKEMTSHMSAFLNISCSRFWLQRCKLRRKIRCIQTLVFRLLFSTTGLSSSMGPPLSCLFISLLIKFAVVYPRQQNNFWCSNHVCLLRSHALSSMLLMKKKTIYTLVRWAQFWTSKLLFPTDPKDFKQRRNIRF